MDEEFTRRTIYIPTNLWNKVKKEAKRPENKRAAAYQAGFIIADWFEAKENVKNV